MADDMIPGDVREFIMRHIDSIAQLEALLLLRANPGETWDIARTAKRLYTGEEEIAEVLGRLCADGLVSCEENLYRYHAAPELDAQVGRLAEAYRRHLIPVTEMIHAKPARIREFANAFRFRKDR